MSEVMIAIIASSSTATVISGIFSIVIYKLKKKDKDAEKEDVVKKALRYIMLYIIQERAKYHINNGRITFGERKALHKWHDLYHFGLDGNGDADLVMDTVDQLEVDYD